MANPRGSIMEYLAARAGRSAASDATRDARRAAGTLVLASGVCHPRPDHLNPPSLP